ncbi:MAG: NADPH-dependent F420 reductase [Bacteroidota bacterium]
MNIAFIGIGNVGFALANNLEKLGHQVLIAHDGGESASVSKAVENNPNLAIQPVATAIAQSEVVFLATPFKAVESALTDLDLNGKILVDCTNPVGPGMKHGLNNEQSGSEFIQKLVPDASLVKAFTIYGFENFINSSYPDYASLKPAMLIAGNDQAGKTTVSDLITQLGWEPVDTGGLSQALHLEHMTLLWIKMARVQGQGSDFVWGRMTR